MAIHGFPGGVISATAPTTSTSGASGVWTVDDALQAGANWPVAPAFATNSVRLRSSASAYMTRTPSVTGSRTTWTYSAWIKRGNLSDYSMLLDAGDGTSNNFTVLQFVGSGAATGPYTISVGNATGGSFNLLAYTSAVFRDPSAWYHIVLVFDTTNATSTNRVKLYVNNVLQTLSYTTGPFAQNTNSWINYTNPHYIGKLDYGSTYYDGYMTEIVLVDGQALDPSYFGATNPSTGVWQPATYRGTYGTNGFYLPMNVTQNLFSVDYLLVAGGGSGANGIGGGGGAGGVLTGTTNIVQGTTYTITVGSGAAGSAASESYVNGNPGSDSSALGITVTGGGYGGTYNNTGGNGGSGGGGGTDNKAGGTGVSGQGYAGGTSNNAYPQQSGGGGGAGGTGANATNSNAGNGGNGLASSITGSSVTYGGGGGGSFNADSTGAVGSGGSGGGTAGGNQVASSNATANTGGGSGGGGYWSLGGGNDCKGSGNGGSGVVILRILTSDYTGTTTGSPTVTTDGSYTVVKFTSSGSYTA